jgi:hypothetical protein
VTADGKHLILNIFFKEEEEDEAGSWCSDQQEGEFEAFSGEEDEGLEPKSLDTHSETEEDEAGSAPPEVVAAAGSAPPEVVAAASSTLERKCGEKRVEFRLPSAEKEEEEGGAGRLARESSAEKEEGRGQIARIFSEGGLLEELRYAVLFVLLLSQSKLIGRYHARVVFIYLIVTIFALVSSF